jgi:hypothetical protein
LTVSALSAPERIECGGHLPVMSRATLQLHLPLNPPKAINERAGSMGIDPPRPIFHP